MNRILQEILELKSLITESALLQKEVLDFEEAARYLRLSSSHLYRLTSTKQIPHFCPQGKKLYFNRKELDDWRQQNRITADSEIKAEANRFIVQNRQAF